MGRLGTDPVTDLVTRPVVTECDVGQPGSRAAGPDRVETNAPPDRREGTGLCIEIPVCAVVGVLLMTESPADVVSLLLGLGWLVLFAGVPTSQRRTEVRVLSVRWVSCRLVRAGESLQRMRNRAKAALRSLEPEE